MKLFYPRITQTLIHIYNKKKINDVAGIKKGRKMENLNAKKKK